MHNATIANLEKLQDLVTQVQVCKVNFFSFCASLKTIFTHKSTFKQDFY